MQLWFKSRGGWSILVGAAIVAAVIAVIGDRAVPFPSFSGSPGAGVPFAVFLPLALCALVLHSLGRAARQDDRVAVRRLVYYDAGMVGAILAASALGFCVAVLLGADPGTALALARNLTGYVGLALLMGGRRQSSGSIWGPTVFCGAVGLYGFGGGQQVHAWAWPAQPPGIAIATLAAAGLIGLGVAAMAWSNRRARRSLRC